MAIYHFKSKIINRSVGPGLIGSAAYRAAERIYDEISGKTPDYKRRQGVLHTEIMAPISAPEWVFDRAKLCNAVESAEKRKDSQLAREIMVALPAELDLKQQIKLLRGYIFQQFVKKGMIADFAIHAPSKKGDDRNYHAHILLTMRFITQEGFGNKNREWNAKSNIYQWRQAWENHTNQALQQAGLDCRVDCRSHAAKGLEQEPRLHLGYQETAIERKGEQSDRGNENRAIEARNEIRAKLCSEQTRTSDELGNLYLDDVSQQQATPPINDSQYSENDVHAAHPDKIIDDIQQDEPSLNSFLNQQINQDLSLEERKHVLEQKTQTFEERKVELNRQIENAPDEKTQERHRLQEKLESSYFTESYNKMLASVLVEEDAEKYVNEIADSQHRERISGKDYQKCLSEWNYRAVRDGDYSPTDQKSGDKVNERKEVEEKKWFDLAVKAERNGWSPSRIERESQILQKRLDRELALNFGLESNLSHGRSMGR